MMSSQQLILFNKPYKVLSQFTNNKHPDGEKFLNQRTLADYIDLPGFYAAGRLDYDSEGLLLLTNSGALQARITEPKYKLEKSYWVQIEGRPSHEALQPLVTGIQLKDGMTLPAKMNLLLSAPDVPEREQPLPAHRDANSSWIQISIIEGRNRQIRRMFAAINHPVLRLIRFQIGPWTLKQLNPGEYTVEKVNMPSKYKSTHRR